MQIKTILNRVEKFKSFIYGAIGLVDGASAPTLEVALQARLNSRPICSGCGQKRPGYNRSPERLFEFIPMWGHTESQETKLAEFLQYQLKSIRSYLLKEEFQLFW